MSEISERLNYLLFERKITAKTFAGQIKITESCISDYLNGKHLPTVENVIRIADYFNRSVDFLLGLEEEKTDLTFKPCLPFAQRLEELRQTFNYTSFAIYSGAQIPKSVYYEWKNGKRQPSIENVIKLAEFFGRRVDFILGRES